MSAVLLLVPFWEVRRVPGIALLMTLAVLPLYISALLRVRATASQTAPHMDD